MASLLFTWTQLNSLQIRSGKCLMYLVLSCINKSVLFHSFPSLSLLFCFCFCFLFRLSFDADVEKYVDGPFKCMGKLLLPSGIYLTEFKIVKSVSLKLALRIRSSPVSAILARIIRSLSLLVELQIPHNFSQQLDSLLK